MKSLPSLLRRSRPKLVLRRVVGGSMRPGLTPGRVILVRTRIKRLAAGDVVVIVHDGDELVKRLRHIKGGRIYVLGDNPDGSTDSRQFGWLPISAIRGTVIWPRSRPPQITAKPQTVPLRLPSD